MEGQYGAAEMSFVKGGFCMIRWKYTNPIDISYIRKTEELLGIRFPEDYVQCVLENNGGTPKPQEFDVEGRRFPAVFEHLLDHDPNSKSYIVEFCPDYIDHLPDGIYPFAGDPFGNFICFDYRSDKDNPSIVFWDHEKPDNKNVFPVCRTFTELLNKLYEPEEDDDIYDIEPIDIKW